MENKEQKGKQQKQSHSVNGKGQSSAMQGKDKQSEQGKKAIKWRNHKMQTGVVTVEQERDHHMANHENPNCQ